MHHVIAPQLPPTSFDANGKDASPRSCENRPCAPLKPSLKLLPLTASTLDTLPTIDGVGWEKEEEARSDDSYDSESSIVTDPDTLIFVDADGVINVGIRDDPGQAPMLMCEDNVRRCKLYNPPPKAGSAKAMSHNMKLASSHQVGHGEECTYSKFATPVGSHDICPLLVQRLAQILVFGGNNCKVVLSSSWRKPTHEKRLAALEAALSTYIQAPFVFDAHTKPGSDEPTKRVELIGDFVSEYSENRQHSDRPLRVVVLEDFSASHPEDWGFLSVEHVEAHLRESSFQTLQTSVKVVHCYDEWTTPSGQYLQVGSGLTRAKVREAERFLLPPSGGGTQPIAKSPHGYDEKQGFSMQGKVPYPTAAGAARNVVLAARVTGNNTPSTDLDSQEHHRGCIEDILDEIGLSDTDKHGIAEDYFTQPAGSRASSKSPVDCACLVSEQDWGHVAVYGKTAQVKSGMSCDYYGMDTPSTSGSNRPSFLTRSRSFKAASPVLGEDRLTVPCHTDECEEKYVKCESDEEAESPSIRRKLPESFLSHPEDFDALLGGEVSQSQEQGSKKLSAEDGKFGVVSCARRD
jgi:hypothetical protein